MRLSFHVCKIEILTATPVYFWILVIIHWNVPKAVFSTQLGLKVSVFPFSLSHPSFNIIAVTYGEDYLVKEIVACYIMLLVFYMLLQYLLRLTYF